MGLASSQARLLNLTARMHQIEYNAARIEAMKLQMANESRRVYEDYLDALDKTKIQLKTLTSNGAVTFVDLKNYEEGFVAAGFALVVHGAEGDIQVRNPEWTGPEDTEHDEYITQHVENGSIVCKTVEELVNAIKSIFTGADGNPLDITTGLTNNFEETLTNLINSGHVTILEKPKADKNVDEDNLDSDGFPMVGTNTFADYETSVAINTSLQEVSDEVELRKAEAKYEADMKRIDMKDRKYDTDLAALDNERNAIKQEMETLKTVAKDNTDRTFKLFS